MTFFLNFLKLYKISGGNQSQLRENINIVFRVLPE